MQQEKCHMPRRRTRPRIGKTGCLFWIVILLVIVVIIVYRGKGSLKQTISNIKNSISGKEVTQEVKKEGSVTTETSQSETAQAEAAKAKAAQKDQTLKTESETGEQAQTTPEKAESQTPALKADEEKIETTRKEVKKSENKAGAFNTRESDLFFVRFNQNDGSVRLVPVTRDVRYIDSPITKTINALLSGPTGSEQEKGIKSLIPDGTSLISASIKNGLLTLNFSDQFEENYSGREAIQLQLSQVLLTSFGFPQVRKVRILIGGKKKQYITGEGIPLKEVYTRQDIPQLSM